MKNDFTPVFQFTEQVSVNSLSTRDVKSISNVDFNGQKDAYFYAELYDAENNLIARNIELGTKPKYFKLLNPHIKIDAKACDEGAYLTFTADALAKNVFVSFKGYDVFLSDNYFDLSNNQPYTIFAKTSLSAKELKDSISIISVYDIPLI